MEELSGGGIKPIRSTNTTSRKFQSHILFYPRRQRLIIFIFISPTSNGRRRSTTGPIASLMAFFQITTTISLLLFDIMTIVIFPKRHPIQNISIFSLTVLFSGFIFGCMMLLFLLIGCGES